MRLVRQGDRKESPMVAIGVIICVMMILVGLHG